MKILTTLMISLTACFFVGCSSSSKLSGKDDGKISINFLQINDVYEIAPISGGKVGGVARVATIKKQLLKKNPNSFMVIAGDFLSPSVFNSLKYNGQGIKGAQMVASLNAAGLDLAVFGNHEFDLKEADLQARLNESTFKWISSNSFQVTKNGTKPFAKLVNGKEQPFAETYIMPVTDKDGTKAKLGFIGINIPFNKPPYVSYTDPLQTAVKLYNQIKDSCDVVIAITHQTEPDDILLAKSIPQLAFIMGGHEHDQRYDKIGTVLLTKAHANARSAYIINLKINTRKNKVTVNSKLKMIDETVPLDSATQVVVNKWTDIANENYASLGFDAKKIVLAQGPDLDGRETEIRSGSTNLTKLIVKAMEAAVPEADLVMINSGSIRVDDILPAPITQYDILRTLPYGGGLEVVDMKGALLLKLLADSKKNIGTGGFLQYSTAVGLNPNNQYTLNDTLINAAKIYTVAITDFLLTGGESNMGYLTKSNPDIIKVYPNHGPQAALRADIRLAIIKYFEKLFIKKR